MELYGGTKATGRTALCMSYYLNRMQISSNTSGQRHNIFLVDYEDVAFIPSHRLHCRYTSFADHASLDI